MTEAEIRAIVLEELGRVAPEADLQQLGADENVRDALDVDSFDALRIVIAINDRLGVEIPESDYGELTTLDRITDYLTKMIDSSPRPAGAR